MPPKISIIVPVYNVEKYLSRCVDSILCQTYQNIEVILVDDGATDSSPSICDEYLKKDDRIKVVHKQNGGLSSARNAGLDVATGDFIGFVDSDDFIAEDMYENLVKEISGDKTNVANCMYVRYYNSGETSPSRVPHTKDEEIEKIDFLKELLLHTGDVSVCSKLFPKKIVENTRFPEDKLNEDLIFIIEIIEKLDKIKFVGKVGYYYYVRQGSISAKYGKTFIDMQKNALWILDLVKEKYPDLKIFALRFALYQNMAYLLAVPKSEANKNNGTYISAVKFVRKNFFASIKNPYLKKKEKVLISALGIMPKTVAQIFKKRKGNSL